MAIIYCCHIPYLYKSLPYCHAVILFIEGTVGFARVLTFFNDPSAMTNGRAIGGFILDWLSSLSATLLGLFVTLTALIVAISLFTSSKDKNQSQVHPDNNDDDSTSTKEELKRMWKSKRLHRFIQLNCNCPCYKTRPRLRFIVRLVYLSSCFILRVIAISLYASAKGSTNSSDSLTGLCIFSLFCLALIMSLDLYQYCVWWHYRPSCDNRVCSTLSKKHKRYLPWHLLGEYRTDQIGDQKCYHGQGCHDRTLEHIMIFHSRDYQPQPRYDDLLKTSSGDTRYIGFHQTDVAAAVNIAHSDFRISTNVNTTMLGQGVYFARSIAATEGKAVGGKGALICAEIEMGRVRTVDINEAHRGTYRGTNDWWDEYDTTYVYHTQDNRDEFCVKDPSQILQWVIVVEKDHDEKVGKYELDKEFEETWCGLV